MNWKMARLVMSSAILAFAVALAGWGIYSMSTFADSSDSSYEAQFFGVDTGFYPFLWGCVLLVIGYLVRFHFRQHALVLVATIGLLVFGWKRLALLGRHAANQDLFLNAGFVSELMVVCGVLLLLALADRYVQRFYDFVRQKVARG